MRRLLARWKAWRLARGARLCHAGKHRWAWIADRVYCNRCQLWR
jgi:hypothetical protein